MRLSVTRIVAKGRDPSWTAVEEVMTRDPESIDSTKSVQEALRLMTEKHFRHLPIIDSTGRVSSILDVVQLLQVG